jgi:hypothetical protein
MVQILVGKAVGKGDVIENGAFTGSKTTDVVIGSPIRGRWSRGTASYRAGVFAPVAETNRTPFTEEG